MVPLEYEPTSRPCERCGRPFVPVEWQRRICSACERKIEKARKRKQAQAAKQTKPLTRKKLPPGKIEERIGWKTETIAINPPRKCQDCGAETYDYRCPACWAKLRGWRDP